MVESSIQNWQSVLKDIADQKRDKLTGGEFKELVGFIEAQRRDVRSMVQTRQLIAQLAQHQGPGAPPPFQDVGHNRAFEVESLPASPPAGDERLRDRVISGQRIYASREYNHTSEAARISDRGEMGRLVHGYRLDVLHKTGGAGDRFDVFQVKTSTHTPYSTGTPGKTVDGERTAHGRFNSLAEATASIDEVVGVKRRSQLISEFQIKHGNKPQEAPAAAFKAPRLG